MSRGDRRALDQPPAFALTGFFQLFAAKRLKLIGAGEMVCLNERKDEAQYAILYSTS